MSSQPANTEYDLQRHIHERGFDILLRLRSNQFLLRLHLEVAVPLMMDRFLSYEWDAQDIADALAKLNHWFSQDASAGMVGAFVRHENGEKGGTYSREYMTHLVEGLALLALCPGGVTFLGVTWEAHRGKMAAQAGIELEAAA